MNEYIIDTSAILRNHKVAEQLPDASIIIPIEVLRELDKHKHDGGIVGFNARAFGRFIDSLGDVIKRVDLENGSTLRVVTSEKQFTTADEAILFVSGHFQNPTVVTDDIYVRVLAASKGVKTLSCDAVFGDTQIYKGVKEINITQLELDQIYANKKAYVSDLYPNQYVILKSEKNMCAYGRYHADLGHITLMNGHPKLQAQVQPKNLYQKFLTDAIVDPSISIVIVHSLAGCGKTIISLAASLYMVRVKQMYHRLVLCKSVAAVGGDKLGFLPGSLEEKLKFWMYGYSDNLALLQQEEIFESPDIEVVSTMHMRGRSIHGAIILVDECQNFTPSEMKTIITRVGNGSKIILMGDVTQIDNPSLNIYNNGLTFVANRFKGQECAAIISLEENERSDISQIAARIL